MANKTINDLTLKAVPATTDELELQETSAGASKHTTAGALVGLITAAQIATALGYTPASTSATLAQFAATTSAQLAGIMTNETGSGALVFATGPTLVTPVLGTPASGDLSNCTNFNIANIAGTASGITAWLADPTSARLATAMTDETGTGVLVFSISPSLTTPVLGVAAATSINKVAITAPATSATLTIADGVTLTVSADATISGTPPSLGANTFTALQTMAVAGVAFPGSVSGTATVVAPATFSGFGSVVLPGVGGTLALLSSNTFTALQTITQASANAGILASTGYSLTGSDTTAMINLAGTWNTSGVVSAIKLNMTSTAVGAGSKLLDFQIAGTSVFGVKRVSTSAYGLEFNNGQNHLYSPFNGTWSFCAVSFGSPGFYLDGVGAIVRSNAYFAFTNSTTTADTTVDTWLTRPAAATIQLGAASAAAPVAQTLQAQGSRSGTDSDVAGGNFTIQSGAGTGSSTGSALIFRAPLAVASGTGAQTMTECFRATAAIGLTIASGLALKLGNAATTGLAAGVLAATTNATVVVTDSAGQAYRIPCII